MRKPIIIYGAGGLGREVLSLVRSIEEWEPLGFIDDGMKNGSILKGVPVLGDADVLSSFTSGIYVVIAVGDPSIKARIVKKINFPQVQYPVLIHPLAVLQDPSSIHLGEGTIIAAGSILTTDIKIGNHVLINLNATIGHDAHIGNYSSVMPGANIAGEVAIGESVLIGSGASIINRVQIGDRSKVGMGAVVIRDVEAGVTVAGVPARRLKAGY